MGPALPPSEEVKRKREEEEEEEEEEEQEDTPESSPDGSTRLLTEVAHKDKRKRTIGPALPQTRTIDDDANSTSTSDSDDDFGPALPEDDHVDTMSLHLERDEAPTQPLSSHNVGPQRDAWMLAPPSSDGWSSRVDPTRLRNRKFNTGKGAKAPPQSSAVDHNLWTETPDEKAKRLQDEAMGIATTNRSTQDQHKRPRRPIEAQATNTRPQEHNEKSRKASLYAEQSKTQIQVPEDDPSQRAFDREKDIGGGATMSHTEKRAFLNKASDFESRFSKGNYL